MRDPKTVTTYLTTMRSFMAWMAAQPGGTPFHVELVTETAVRGYMDSLKLAGRAPRTRSKALSALRRFCQWAVDEGHLRRNPARSMERPTVVAMAPTELSPDQRFVLKQLVERHATRRVAAIFALGYWAGLRISEIAALRVDQCHINQRAGSITLIDAKGARPGRLICTIWHAERSLTISPPSVHKKWSGIKRVSTFLVASGPPGCGNRDDQIIFLNEALSISGCNSSSKEQTPNGSPLRTLPFMIYAMTLPIAHGRLSGRWKKSRSM